MSLARWFVAKKGLIDWWSLGHLAWGIVLGILLISLRTRFASLKQAKYFFRVGSVILVLWEILEIIARYFEKYFMATILSPMAEHENWINILSDLAIGLISLSFTYLIYNRRFQREENDKIEQGKF